jgi:hypothetical protein
VEIRKRSDTGSKPRDYRYAPMGYQSEIGEDGLVEATFSATTDMGDIDVHFASTGSLSVMNKVVDPLNHAMEVIPILYLEKQVAGNEKTRVHHRGRPVTIRSSNFTLGANYGIIFRTDKRIESLKRYMPGRKGLIGSRWIYDFQGGTASYSISKQKDEEGYYEIKRLTNFVQKAWIHPLKNAKRLKKISTYSLAHRSKEFMIVFDPPLSFPKNIEGDAVIRGTSKFKSKISNSGWDVQGKVEMKSLKKADQVRHLLEFYPQYPAFLAKRSTFYDVYDSAQRYEVNAKEGDP